MESFFGRLKTECFYGREFNTREEIVNAVRDYLDYYNHRRIQLKLKGLNIGFWAFSFGLASLANGAVSFVHHNVLSGLANGAFIFANLMMSGLVLMTLGKIFKGQFWLK